MGHLRASRFADRLGSAVVLRYGLPLVSVAAALGLSLLLERYRLPRLFGSFSFVAIAISFWYAGTGSGLLGVLLSCLAMGFFLSPITEVRGPGWESFLIIYVMFGALAGWFSASRRRAERLLTEARDNLEVRVAERTSELTQANTELQSTQAELRYEKDRLKLLLDVTNQVVSNLELRDLLRAISGSVRRAMQCDYASLSLPDEENKYLRLYMLDFPDGKGFLKEEAIYLVDGSPSGTVFQNHEAFDAREPLHRLARLSQRSKCRS